MRILNWVFCKFRSKLVVFFSIYFHALSVFRFVIFLNLRSKSVNVRVRSNKKQHETTQSHQNGTLNLKITIFFSLFCRRPCLFSGFLAFCYVSLSTHTHFNTWELHKTERNEIYIFVGRLCGSARVKWWNFILHKEKTVFLFFLVVLVERKKKCPHAYTTLGRKKNSVFSDEIFTTITCFAHYKCLQYRNYCKCWWICTPIRCYWRGNKSDFSFSRVCGVYGLFQLGRKISNALCFTSSHHQLQNSLYTSDNEAAILLHYFDVFRILFFNIHAHTHTSINYTYALYSVAQRAARCRLHYYTYTAVKCFRKRSSRLLM